VVDSATPFSMATDAGVKFVPARVMVTAALLTGIEAGEIEVNAGAG